MLNETAKAEALWQAYLAAAERTERTRELVLKPLEERRNAAYAAWADEYRATHGDDHFISRFLEAGEAQAEWATAEELAP